MIRRYPSDYDVKEECTTFGVILNVIILFDIMSSQGHFLNLLQVIYKELS